MERINGKDFLKLTLEQNGLSISTIGNIYKFKSGYDPVAVRDLAIKISEEYEVIYWVTGFSNVYSLYNKIQMIVLDDDFAGYYIQSRNSIYGWLAIKTEESATWYRLLLGL